MFIDAHSHLDKYSLTDDQVLDTILDEIKQNHILTISNSMDPQSYHQNLKIGETCKFVFPIFGVHPWNAGSYHDRLGELNKYIDKSPMIGEIGLDHFFIEDASAYPAQNKVFRYFLAAAKKQDKIINIHTKGAEREVLELLDEYEINRVIVHWYSVPIKILRKMIDRGAYFTVGPDILFSTHIQAIAHEIPMNRVLTETDNPGGPMSLTGKIGMPSLICDVVQAVAKTKKVTAEKILKIVHSNLLRLIQDDHGLLGVENILQYS